MSVNQSDLKNKMVQKASVPMQSNKSGQTNMATMIKSMEDEIKRALPSQISADRFARIALTTVRSNPRLESCDPLSFIAALMQSAQLGLEPNTPLGQAYILPYGREAQFQLGYQGMITLAYRTGEFKTIFAMEVYEGDEFEYRFGLDANLVHVPGENPQGEPTHYYAVYKLINGGEGFTVMSRKQVERHKNKYSPSAKGSRSPWVSAFDEMAKKTVLKKVLKYAPKSVEFAEAFHADETIKKRIDERMTEVESIEVDFEVDPYDDPQEDYGPDEEDKAEEEVKDEKTEKKDDKKTKK